MGGASRISEFGMMNMSARDDLDLRLVSIDDVNETCCEVIMPESLGLGQEIIQTGKNVH